MNAREEELIARHLLEHQEEIDVCFKNKEWDKLAALVRYARHDAPESLTHSDPALYRHLRECITRFRIRGGDGLFLTAFGSFSDVNGDGSVCTLKVLSSLSGKPDRLFSVHHLHFTPLPARCRSLRGNNYSASESTQKKRQPHGRQIP